MDLGEKIVINTFFSLMFFFLLLKFGSYSSILAGLCTVHHKFHTPMCRNVFSFFSSLPSFTMKLKYFLIGRRLYEIYSIFILFCLLLYLPFVWQVFFFGFHVTIGTTQTAINALRFSTSSCFEWYARCLRIHSHGIDSFVDLLFVYMSCTAIEYAQCPRVNSDDDAMAISQVYRWILHSNR